DRELDQVRALVHQAARCDRLRGRVPRTHDALDDDDLEDAPVQGGPRPVRTRGLSRALPPRVPGHRRRVRAPVASTRVPAAGLPLSAVIGKAEIMDAPPDSAIGGTYVGNPVAQAAAVAVLDVFDEESLVERAQTVGDTIRARMVAWQERWEKIGDVRGLGAML